MNIENKINMILAIRLRAYMLTHAQFNLEEKVLCFSHCS